MWKNKAVISDVDTIIGYKSVCWVYALLRVLLILLFNNRETPFDIVFIIQTKNVCLDLDII